MELRSRVEKLMRPCDPTPLPPVSSAVTHLVKFEKNISLHRWLRGVMCFLFFLCYILSIFQIENYAGSIVVHVLMLLISLGGEVCLFFIYRIKADFSGLTNGANPATKAVSVLHSPYAGLMLFEMVLWILQSPPGLRNKAWVDGLDSLVLLRVYVFACFISEVASRHVFRRAIATVQGQSFRCRTPCSVQFLFAYTALSLVGFVLSWLCLALLYSKAEVVSYNDAMYFCMSTAAFVGYGDVVPVTFAGRVTAVLAWLLGCLILVWVVGSLHELLTLSTAEQNLHILFHANKRCARVPDVAARTIQRAWKLYCAKKEERSGLSVHLSALLLTYEVVQFRRARRELVAAEQSFLRSTTSFEDVLASVMPAASSATTPRTTPRHRRPFALHHNIAPKTPRESPPTPPLKSPAASASAATAPPSASPNVGGVADVEQRMAELEATLDGLIAQAEQLSA